ncbi:putative mitochondrial carrier [Neolecta irregularis DAH-3]|uniref:Putative mitochondrial carrier n=1 Tax=Neolecta irregularis (strain DAH-3) TaxID=1198029 RepID=A0A1U7LHG3_NEOID|nr:putative mitochondrial carrier [Neolecta irregularis DAH-3]|eukprot:OLL22084.1 putative mitochondrial carrier [Neolecta irregularis DAH-3]
MSSDPTDIPLTSTVASIRPKKSLSFSQSWVHFLAGGAGGMTGAVLTSPLDVVKTRLQSDFYRDQIVSRRAATLPQKSCTIGRAAARHFSETCQILGDIYRVEGPRALFKGLGPNLVGVVPARAINFYTYGNGKRIIADSFNNGRESTWVHLASAAIAGIVTSTATNPIWLVKTRLQLDRQEGGMRQYKNSFDCLLQVFRKEGVVGLYRGMSASYLGVTESTMQWVLYEHFKKIITERSVGRRLLSLEPTGWDTFVEWGGKLGAAGSAKFLAAGVTYPHEVLRTRLRQTPTTNGQLKYTGLIQCFKLVWKEEGMVALYGGLTAHLMRVVPNAAIMFGAYELVLHMTGSS